MRWNKSHIPLHRGVKYGELLEPSPETEPLHHARPLEYAQSRFRCGVVQVTDSMTLSAGMSATTPTTVYYIHEGKVRLNSQ